MQLLAMITMLIDHVGQVYFPDEVGWRIAGRIAFPIYAYYIVVGYRHTKSVTKYMNRLLLLALISQLPFMLALDQLSINAVGSLYLCLIILYFLDRKQPLLSVPLTFAAGGMMELLHFDYGFYGLLLVLIYRYLRGHYTLLAHLILIVIFARIKDGWGFQMFSILSTVAIIYGPKLYNAFERRTVPKWLWRSFYPAHLFLIAFLKLF